MIINHWIATPQNQAEVNYLKTIFPSMDIQLNCNYKISDEIYSDILAHGFSINGLPVDAMIR